MSEAITNQLGADHQISAKSAGSQPVGQVHPLSIEYLDANAYSTKGLKSQSWDEFESFSPDLVITVCDSAANETCPVYFSNTNQMHWGLADPSKVSGTSMEIAEAFNTCIRTIEARVTLLIDLKNKGLNALQIKSEIEGRE
ncbi:hypothetical protein GCM10007852_21180 [Agaribacter marinus]|uniref:Phosphotyrosine protein phosphatase I domain-containing protein n=1 Tax=Agaribacter marinus TaxID=1431249 RepID=A0AA37WKS6_9ALTE|nr:hypothetical protein GCM10007852_21180 [Agaribacter marinus]